MEKSEYPVSPNSSLIDCFPFHTPKIASYNSYMDAVFLNEVYFWNVDRLINIGPGNLIRSFVFNEFTLADINELIPRSAAMKHLLEISHKFLSTQTKFKCFMRYLAGITYSYIDQLGSEYAGTDKILIPTFSNFPALRLLKDILEVLHYSIVCIEEILSLFYTMKFLTDQEKRGIDLDSLNIYPDKIKAKAFQKMDREIDDFKDMYRKFEKAYERVGDDFFLWLPLYALNGPQLPLDPHFPFPSYQIKLGDTSYLAKEKKELKTLYKESAISPYQRFRKILSKVENIPFVNLRDWNRIKFSLLMLQVLPDFENTLYPCRSCRLRYVDSKKEPRFVENMKVFSCSVAKKFMFWSEQLYKIRSFDPETKAPFLQLSLRPSFYIMEDKLVAFSGSDEFIDCLFLESIKQQLFKGTGLKCIFYLLMMCEDIKSNAPEFCQVIRNIWRYVEIDPDAKCETCWEKPQCMT